MITILLREMEIDDGVVREFEEGMERERDDTTHRGTLIAMQRVPGSRNGSFILISMDHFIFHRHHGDSR